MRSAGLAYPRSEGPPSGRIDGWASVSELVHRGRVGPAEFRGRPHRGERWKRAPFPGPTWPKIGNARVIGAPFPRNELNLEFSRNESEIGLLGAMRPLSHGWDDPEGDTADTKKPACAPGNRGRRAYEKGAPDHSIRGAQGGSAEGGF